MWYPIESGTRSFRVEPPQPGLSGVRRHEAVRPWNALLTKPSIRPPSTSACAAVFECGPPSSISEVSWNGRTQ